MVQVEVRRKQLAIAGVITNAQTQKALGEVLVSITDAPDAFVSKLITRLLLVSLPSQQQAALQKVLDATTNQTRLAAIQDLLLALPAPLVKMILPNRLDRTYTTADGGFYFTDLPDGQYAIAASLPQLGRRYGITQADNITVARDATGNLPRANVNLSLPPTTLKGQIVTEETQENVALAEIRIQGSGDITFSDRQGKYLLTELETSNLKRIVEVKASGFESQTQEILLDEVGGEQILDFVMKK